MATLLEPVASFSGPLVGVSKLVYKPSCSSPLTRMYMLFPAKSVAESFKINADSKDNGPISGGKSVFPVHRGLKMSLPGRPAQAIATSRVARVSKGTVSEVQETITAAGVVNQTTFQKLVLDSDIPVLVDFWAPWCGPCRMIAPLIDELARQYAGKLKCLKLNTDESPDIATEYGIRSIPTVMIFIGGEKKDTVIGAVPKSTLTTTIEKYLD